MTDRTEEQTIVYDNTDFESLTFTDTNPKVRKHVVMLMLNMILSEVDPDIDDPHTDETKVYF